MPRAFVTDIDNHRIETAVEPAVEGVKVTVIRPLWLGQSRIPDAFNSIVMANGNVGTTLQTIVDGSPGGAGLSEPEVKDRQLVGCPRRVR